MPADEYLEHSNREKIVILQIESPEGLEQVEKICAVPGFDGVCFGPGDFSHRIGKVGQLDDPAVVAARRRVAAACRESGKFAMASGLFAALDVLVGEGFGLFCLGADVIGLAQYVKQRLEFLRSQPAAMTPRPATGRSPYG